MTAPASFRRLILFCGPQPWGKQAASRLISSSKLPADQIYWHQPDDDAFDLLGQDRAIAVVDTYQGLHPRYRRAHGGHHRRGWSTGNDLSIVGRLA